MHRLYTGVTQSGKTTLARAHARELAKTRSVVVYDPLGTSTAGGAWGKKSAVFDDVDDFLNAVYADTTVNCHVFVDEAHHVFAHGEKSNLWMLTQGRHYGMQMHLITQRPTKVHPDARTNCAECYMFRLAQDDAKSIGSDYGFSDIHKINLDRGDFLVLNSGSSEFHRANVFNLLEK